MDDFGRVREQELVTEKSNGEANPATKSARVLTIAADPDAPMPPQTIVDLAQACVDYVERAVGVAPDFQVETLPLLDHYLANHASAAERQETQQLVVAAASAYLGEVVRGRFKCWWRPQPAAQADPSRWIIDFVDVELSFMPAAAVEDALRGSSKNALAAFNLPKADQQAAAQRLDELPSVSETEYVSTATRLEVLDIVFDVAKQGVAAEDGKLSLGLTVDDYDD